MRQKLLEKQEEVGGSEGDEDLFGDDDEDEDRPLVVDEEGEGLGEES